MKLLDDSKLLLIGIAGASTLALGLLAVVIWVAPPVPVSPALRVFHVEAMGSTYRISAHETRQRDVCTTFLQHGIEVAGVCGTHTWSESADEKGMVY